MLTLDVPLIMKTCVGWLREPAALGGCNGHHGAEPQANEPGRAGAVRGSHRSSWSKSPQKEPVPKFKTRRGSDLKFSALIVRVEGHGQD